ncbi:hypothetical protein G9A89_005885 [Geosiphon pyriformis]|nr:hypothetical protein G9A89_005885 [Geosiphon pyriformis]
MGNLVSIFTESKLKGKVCPWLANKFDGVWVFTSSLDSGFLGAGVLIVMNSSLARHVFKVSEVPGQLLSVRLLFKNKLSVSILGLYAGASSSVRFSQAGNINSLIAKAVNEFSFVVLGGDFNEDGVCKSASFKKCFDLGLVNALGGSVLTKTPTWGNSRGVVKTIDYMFVSSSLVNAVMDRGVTGVEDFFDTDHKTVSVSVDCWKFNFGNAGKKEWNNFMNAMLANGLMFSSNFAASAESSDLDAMWDIVRKVMVLSAVGTFKKKWFKSYDEVFTKSSSRFHKLELLISKLVKVSCLLSSVEFVSLLNTWEKLNVNGASVVKFLFLLNSSFDRICSVLAKARKSYHSAKLLESKRAEKSHIRAAIDKRMESFESNKGHTIRSVLERPFCKVVLDHLVVGDELILEPSSVKARVDGIMEGWTRKRKLFSVVSGLPEGKTAGLSGILNELWKHCDRSILDMLLVLLNSCLIHESIPSAWKEAWVSIIPKLYE